MLTLSSFKGKVVLLEFMEPWCPHCQNMAPVLANLYAQYGKQNVVFISVAGPWNGATGSDAMSFINQYGSGWTYVYDSSGTIFSEYGVNSTPTFYIIAPNGAVSTSLVGEQTLDTLSGALSAAGAT
jgi:thiol-disulfide isomerase/thioredoxin